MKVYKLLFFILVTLLFACSGKDKIQYGQWYESKFGHGFLLESNGRYKFKTYNQNFGYSGSYEKVSSKTLNLLPFSKKGQEYRISIQDGDFYLGNQRFSLNTPRVKEAPPQLEKGLWYSSRSQSRGFLFRGDGAVEELTKGESLGVVGQYQFNDYLQRVEINYIDDRQLQLSFLGTSNNLAFEDFVLGLNDFKSSLKVKQSKWYLSENRENGYLFHRNGKYSVVKGGLINRNFGHYRVLDNGSFMILGAKALGVEVFYFNNGQDIVVENQEFRAVQSLKFTKDKVSRLSYLLRKLKVRYKESYSLNKIMSFVKKKKKSLSKSYRNESYKDTSFQKFTKRVFTNNDLGGTYFYGAKSIYNSELGTKTKYGYFKEKDAGKYIFVTGIMRKGTHKRYHPKDDYYYGYTYRCTLRRLSANQLPKELLLKIDPKRAQELERTQNAIVQDLTTVCDNILVLLEEGIYLKRLAQVAKI